MANILQNQSNSSAIFLKISTTPEKKNGKKYSWFWVNTDFFNDILSQFPM